MTGLAFCPRADTQRARARYRAPGGGPGSPPAGARGGSAAAGRGWPSGCAGRRHRNRPATPARAPPPSA